MGPPSNSSSGFLFTPLREHPRFQALLAKLKLT
jgi:hypothetical protein